MRFSESQRPIYDRPWKIKKYGGVNIMIKKLCLLFLLGFLLALLSGCTTDRFPPAYDPNIKYFAYGDSVTRGAIATGCPQGVINPNSGETHPDCAYPGQLDDMIASVYCNGVDGCVANRGSSGETLNPNADIMLMFLNPKTPERLYEELGMKAYTTDYYPNVDTVLFWEGGNDVLFYINSVNHALDRYPSQAEIEYIQYQIVNIYLLPLAEELILEGYHVILGTYHSMVIPQDGASVALWGTEFSDPAIPIDTRVERLVKANHYVFWLNMAIFNAAAYLYGLYPGKIWVSPDPFTNPWGSAGFGVGPLGYDGEILQYDQNGNIVTDPQGNPLVTQEYKNYLKNPARFVYYNSDGLHPAYEGYTIIAEKWFNAIQYFEEFVRLP
jgi:lysophospholipase L1-like esterase